MKVVVFAYALRVHSVHLCKDQTCSRTCNRNPNPTFSASASASPREKKMLARPTLRLTVRHRPPWRSRRENSTFGSSSFEYRENTFRAKPISSRRKVNTDSIYIKSWDNLESIADGFAVIRAVERKYGRIREFKFMTVCSSSLKKNLSNDFIYYNRTTRNIPTKGSSGPYSLPQNPYS
jgi:hypothetical protein